MSENECSENDCARLDEDGFEKTFQFVKHKGKSGEHYTKWFLLLMFLIGWFSPECLEHEYSRLRLPFWVNCFDNLVLTGPFGRLKEAPLQCTMYSPRYDVVNPSIVLEKPQQISKALISSNIFMALFFSPQLFTILPLPQNGIGSRCSLCFYAKIRR